VAIVLLSRVPAGLCRARLCCLPCGLLQSWDWGRHKHHVPELYHRVYDSQHCLNLKCRLFRCACGPLRCKRFGLHSPGTSRCCSRSAVCTPDGFWFCCPLPFCLRYTEINSSTRTFGTWCAWLFDCSVLGRLRHRQLHGMRHWHMVGRRSHQRAPDLQQLPSGFYNTRTCITCTIVVHR
jgi:hypothetical protein